MIKFFGYVLIKENELPGLHNALLLARCLSENDIEDIMAKKKHLHRNPPKRKGVKNELLP